jgi:UDPglucose 6-dehydrogenase
MKLAIAGTGYVGLVTGTGLANLGNEVTCIDIDKKKVNQLSSGDLTIYEPALEEIFKRNIKGKRLSFSTDIKKAVQESEIIFICVGTPCNKDNEADLSAVKSIAEAIGRHMNSYKIIVNKSTVPVGTADLVRRIIKKHQDQPIDFDVVSNPEFLREGAAVKDFENPDRIVIGTDSKKAGAIMSSLYRSVARVSRPIMLTDIKSAEIIKYASNAMLATRISFMNQLSHLCEKTGADIGSVARGMGLDSRIGSRFLQAGLGYGGSCFPKDVKALASTLNKHGCRADLFEAVDRINEHQKMIVIDKLKTVLDISKSTIAVWGLSFKPKTDDIRDSPAIAVIEILQQMGAGIHAFDPVAAPNAKQVLNNVTFFDNPYETARDCDALVVATEWNEFRNLDMKLIRTLLKTPVIIDGRNIYNPEELEALGITCLGIGR